MKQQRAKNIALIGMPGSGKSTIGIALANALRWPFIDTDRLIEKTCGKNLQDIVDQDGYMHLRDIEAKAISNLDVHGHVIATGGSAIYSSRAMQHLGSIASVIFIDVPIEIIAQRIDNFSSRGLARQKNQSLRDLYEERYPLYIKYADIRIDCAGKNIHDLRESIVQQCFVM